MAFDEQIAAITVYCEASNCTQSEKEAIVWVIRNRVGRWQPTMAGVCLQRMQFSEWNADQIDNKNLLRAANVSEDDPVMQQCIQAVQWHGPDPTNGATHYHDKSISPPNWTDNMTTTLETEHFIFYKD